VEGPHDVDAAPVAWREAGRPDASVVLFLHGLGGSRTAWEPQLATIGATYRAVAWDMPGYGATAPPSEELTFPLLADAAAALIERLGGSSAHVVGLSFGSMVALHLAHRHPERVRSLALLSTSPRFGFDGTTTAAAWTAARLAPLDAGETPATMAGTVMRAIAAPGTPAEVLAPQEAAMRRISPEGLRAAVHCLTTHDATAFLDRLADPPVAPALVMVGELDRETPPPYGAAVASGLRARLVVVPGAGHLLPAEAAGTVNAALLRFFDRVESSHHQEGP
jgi:3-oxoadipate enol-lactonase